MSTAPQPTEDALALLHEELRTGYAAIALFDGPDGPSRVEILGPKGMRPGGDFLLAEVPTLRLWVPARNDAPVAVVAANCRFDAGLRAIEQQARPHLHPPDLVWLGALLRIVRSASKVPRPRVPPMGDTLTEEGEPSLRAWASCLTLGDLETAMLKALA